jgi:hypothetical protein
MPCRKQAERDIIPADRNLASADVSEAAGIAGGLDTCLDYLLHGIFRSVEEKARVCGARRDGDSVSRWHNQ